MSNFTNCAVCKRSIEKVYAEKISPDASGCDRFVCPDCEDTRFIIITYGDNFAFPEMLADIYNRTLLFSTKEDAELYAKDINEFYNVVQIRGKK